MAGRARGGRAVSGRARRQAPERNGARNGGRRNGDKARSPAWRVWRRRALAVLGSGWAVLSAGIAIGIVALVVVADGTALNAPREAVEEAAGETAAPERAAAPAASPVPAGPDTASAPHPAGAPRAGTPRRDAPSDTLPPAAAPAPPALAALPAPPPVAESAQPAWLRHAVAIPDPGARPLIAVVIDDLGLNRPNSARAIALPGPVTLAFLTYADDLARQTAAARRAGHELLVHMPMEPMDPAIDPGPDVLDADAPPGRLLEQLRRNLDAFDGYVGINNHMGSRFTATEPAMRLVLGELKRRGLLFLDSLTIGSSVGASVAAQLGLPFATRDVFLDNVQSADAVEAQLAEVERIARTSGHAVAIGHPHDATIEALAAWLPHLAERGFALVPLSAIVKRELGLTG